MKLITAIKMIEEREKQKRNAEKEKQRKGLTLKNDNINNENEQKNLVHVQSIFPQDDVVALKVKTRESHVREAISKAVYYYLRYANEGNKIE